MQYNQLGRAGVKVSMICLGHMNFGGSADEPASRAIMDRAVESGINFFDTANVYQKSRSEEILGRWFKDTPTRRDKIILATKVYGKAGDEVNDRGLSRRHIKLACEQSLRRLQTDRIDLYQCHHWDVVPIEETIRAMDDLVRDGKIVYWGTSNFKAWHLTEATLKAEQAHMAIPVTEQSPYTITNRQIENELGPFCMKYGVHIIPWSPLGGGRLARDYVKGQSVPESPRNQGPEFQERIAKNRPLFESLTELARGLGHPLVDLAYAFLFHQTIVASVIIGPRTIDHLDQALKALEVKLDPDALAKIDTLVPPGSSPDYFGW